MSFSFPKNPVPTGQMPDPEPWAETPNELRRALIEIADLRSENQTLHERLHALLSRVRELGAARGEVDRD